MIRKHINMRKRLVSLREQGAFDGKKTLHQIEYKIEQRAKRRIKNFNKPKKRKQREKVRTASKTPPHDYIHFLPSLKFNNALDNIKSIANYFAKGY